MLQRAAPGPSRTRQQRRPWRDPRGFLQETHIHDRTPKKVKLLPTPHPHACRRVKTCFEPVCRFCVTGVKVRVFVVNAKIKASHYEMLMFRLKFRLVFRRRCVIVSVGRLERLHREIRGCGVLTRCLQDIVVVFVPLG